MALIEIDGLPNLIAWWIFPWRTVKLPDGNSNNSLWFEWYANNELVTRANLNQQT